LIAGRLFALSSLVVAVVALALALPASALAAEGDPDTSFSGDGQLTTGFGTTPFHAADSGNAAARLSTGEVYVAGKSGGDFALVRFTAAGVLDTTFGGGDGIVITDISGAGSDDQAFAVSVDTATGKVVVAGQTGNNETADFALVRYTSSGALDPGFGGDGTVTTDFPTAVEDVALAVTSLAGGGVIAAGFTDTDPDGDLNPYDFALAAYTSSGTLDPSFDGDAGNGNGLVTTDFGSDDDFANAALLTTAGSKIVVAGSTDPAGSDTGDFAVARYSTSTGLLDSTFDGDGKQTVSFTGTGNGDGAFALATDSSSRVLVAGFVGPGNGDFAVARLDGTSGALDNTFSTDGKQVVSTPSSPPTLNSQDLCYSVLVQADGKIVLAGHEGSANGRFLLMRLDGTTGTPDSTFDTDGIVITDFGGNLFAGAAAVFADETASKLIAAGTGNDNFAAARYAMSNGSLDGTYGVGGKAEADVPHAVQSSESARGVALQPDGKIVVVGPTNVDSITQVGGDQQFGLARYNPDGTLDAGFGAGGVDGNGRVSTNFDLEPNGAGTTDSPAAVALQSDGKIVVVGKTDPVGSDLGDFAIARYEADGDLDPTFDNDGLVTTDFGGTFQGDVANAVAIEGAPGDPSFRIVVAGAKSGTTQAQDDFAIAVYEEDGTPDNSFDSDGEQTTEFGKGDVARGVAVQPDGSIVAAGSSAFFTPDGDFALARYQSNGTPDPGFGSGGEVVTDFDPTSVDDVYSLALQDLGSGQVRIVVGGRTGISSTAAGAMAAYTTDGSLDPSFAPGGADGDGKLTVELGSPTNFDIIRGLAIRSDGKIVGAGSVESPDFGAIRVSQAGALDPAFGGDGLVSTAFPNPNFDQRTAFSLALQPDEKVVAAGGALSPFNGSDFLVARYAPDSSPTTIPPAQQPPTAPATPTSTKKKKCKKKKKHRAASVAKKKCKKKKR
jgi:uncharacterized delta-60 repeat protein